MLKLLAAAALIPASIAWEPYETPSFTLPAGAVCTFELRADVLADEERIATLATFPDGSPRVQVIKGDLRMRFTNTSTKARTEEDLNGVGVIEYAADGGETFRAFGPGAVVFRPGDRYRAGFWILDGYHEVYTAPGFAYREMRVDGGGERNVCDALD